VLRCGVRAAGVRSGWAAVGVGHVLHRDLDPEVERLALAGVDDRAVAVRADEEARDALEWALRRRKAYPLGVLIALGGHAMRKALEGQGEVGAALRRRDRVDLVHDHRLDAAEAPAGPRRLP